MTLFAWSLMGMLNLHSVLQTQVSETVFYSSQHAQPLPLHEKSQPLVLSPFIILLSPATSQAYDMMSLHTNVTQNAFSSSLQQ